MFKNKEINNTYKLGSWEISFATYLVDGIIEITFTEKITGYSVTFSNLTGTMRLENKVTGEGIPLEPHDVVLLIQRLNEGVRVREMPEAGELPDDEVRIEAIAH